MQWYLVSCCFNGNPQTDRALEGTLHTAHCTVHISREQQAGKRSVEEPSSANLNNNCFQTPFNEERDPWATPNPLPREQTLPSLACLVTWLGIVSCRPELGWHVFGKTIWSSSAGHCPCNSTQGRACFGHKCE